MVIQQIKRLFSKKHAKGCKCTSCLPCMPKGKRIVKKKATKKKKGKK